jgi:hypothetical protein
MTHIAVGLTVIATLMLGDGIVIAEETTEPPTTVSGAAPTTAPGTPFVAVELTDAMLHPDAELCSSYWTLQQLLLPVGPVGGQVVDAWFAVNFESSTGVANARLTDDQRSQLRSAFMGCATVVAPTTVAPVMPATTVAPVAPSTTVAGGSGLSREAELAVRACLDPVWPISSIVAKLNAFQDDTELTETQGFCDEAQRQLEVEGSAQNVLDMALCVGEINLALATLAFKYSLNGTIDDEAHAEYERYVDADGPVLDGLLRGVPGECSAVGPPPTS